MHNAKTIETYMVCAHDYKDEIFERGLVNVIKKDFELRNIVGDESIKPIWSGLKVTGLCNFACEHCWARLAKEKRTYKEIIAAVDKLHEIGVLHITVSGGEPFLRDDIKDILKYIKHKGMHLSVYTNGSLLSKKLIDELETIMDETDVVQISLDGANKDTFYKQRKSMLFEKVLENIGFLGSSCITTRVNMVATYINISEIEAVYKICNKLKVDTFSLSYVYDLNKGKSIYNKECIDKYLEQVTKCIGLSDLYQTKFKPFIPIDYYSVQAQRSIYHDKVKFPSYDLMLYRFINSKGDIYPEVSLEEPELKIGNIFEDDAEVILNKSIEIGNKLIMRDLKNTKCASCSMLENCRGGDMGRSYRIYKTVDCADPYCEVLDNNE